ncbi:unnamed protein product [Closterium sp. Yama58-4]|nr:unnamed protein product [Closterium sp. Yama58-4]
MGPALVAADVTAEEGDVTRWRVTYRVWDTGNYSVLVQSECDTLDFAPDYLERVKSTGSHVMGQWVLTVLPSTEPATEPAAAAESHPSSKIPQDATDGPDSPCDHSIHGRWLFTPQQKAYTWQLYPCAQPLPPTSQWVSALQSRGISEINFVGDSHLRFLFHHLYFLLTGKANASTVKLHGDIRLVVPPPSPELQPLKLNFYWIGGIYVDGPFGCVKKESRITSLDRLKFPAISTTADNGTGLAEAVAAGPAAAGGTTAAAAAAAAAGTAAATAAATEIAGAAELEGAGAAAPGEG